MNHALITGMAYLNFAVFIGGLIYAAKNPFKEFRSRRRKNVEERVATAREQYHSAQTAYQIGLARKAKLSAETEDIKLVFKKEAEQEKVELIASAEKTAQQTALEVKRRLVQEKTRQEKKIIRRVLEQAIGTAEQTIRQGLGAEQQRQWLSSSLERLRQMKNFGVGPQ